jgi:nucleoid DNA-binding protein
MAPKKNKNKAATKPKVKVMAGPELVAELSDRTGIGKTDIKHTLAELQDVVQECLGQARKVKIGNIVQLETKVRKGIKKGTMVMNPAKGEKVRHPGKPPSVKVTARVLAGVGKGDHLPSVQKVQKTTGKK